MYTRRDFAKSALGMIALPAAARLWAQEVAGVRLGVQTYSFREIPRAADGDAVGVVIAAMKDAGFTECELWAAHVEPSAGPRGGGGGGRRDPNSPEAKEARERARRWRVETPLDHFRGVGKRFKDAGITVYAYNYSFNSSMSDAEIDRGFEIARALGAEIITASSRLDVAPRVVPYADKHKMVVAMHNHSDLKDPNEFATPASFEAAMKMSRYFKVNLDVGHFTAANFDAVDYIRKHHASITNLHLKDRGKDQGDTVPWGTGDAPIREVLQLLKREKWPIRAYVEYEYKGAGTPVEESRKCLEYAKQALAAT
jgi:sugar phosphate isomerase/epimerase